MRYAAFKGPRSQHVEKLWMIGSCLEVPEVLGAFVLVALTSIVFASTKKTAPTEFPCHVWQLPAFGSLRFRDKRLPSQHPNPDAMFFIFFFRAEIGVPLGLKAAWENFPYVSFCFWCKKSEDFRRFSVGGKGWTFHVRWMVLLLWSFHQACWPQFHDVVFCCYAMVVDPSGPWGHNQVLGEEILERFAAVVSWPSKKEKDHFENVPRMFVWMFRIINSNLLNHICCICQVIARFMEI